MTLQQLEKIRELDKLAQDAVSCVALPNDTTFDFNEFSVEARLWLYEASLGPTQCRNAGIGYSNKLRRVVLPVFNTSFRPTEHLYGIHDAKARLTRANSELRFYQLRRLIGAGAKYISPEVDRSSILYFCEPDGSSLDEVIITEDILSAIRVGQHIPAASLLGTSISTQQAAILSRFKKVTTWLDPDKAGIEGACSIRRALSLTSEVRNITSEKDPKLLSNRQILEHLNNDQDN